MQIGSASWSINRLRLRRAGRLAPSLSMQGPDFPRSLLAAPLTCRHDQWWNPWTSRNARSYSGLSPDHDDRPGSLRPSLVQELRSLQGASRPVGCAGSPPGPTPWIAPGIMTTCRAPSTSEFTLILRSLQGSCDPAASRAHRAASLRRHADRHQAGVTGITTIRGGVTFPLVSPVFRSGEGS